MCNQLTMKLGENNNKKKTVVWGSLFCFLLWNINHIAPFVLYLLISSGGTILNMGPYFVFFSEILTI